MSFFDIERDGDSTFIIAEVGQNHNGDVVKAVEYVREFSKRGACAVKFQVRDNKRLFSTKAYKREYNSTNAFASTYGAHREALELSKNELAEVRDVCRDEGVKFMATPFDSWSLDLLVDLGVDCLKMASFDCGNLPFIELALETEVPLVLSTGGANQDVIDATVEKLGSRQDRCALLHCVSEYPCPIEILGLGKIPYYISRYPGLLIGLSDHFNGTLSGPLAFMVGARVFEKHVTFNRAQKGTDHPFSLEPDGFGKFVRDIRRAPLAFGEKEKSAIGKEMVFGKLGKKLILKSNKVAGELITEEDLDGMIFSPDELDEYSINVRDSYQVIGTKLSRNVRAGHALKWTDMEA